MENLLIAKVVKPQGIKGEVKCMLYTDVFEAVTKAKRLLTSTGECQVERAVIRGGFLYLKFLGINDRNNAEIFRNQLLYLPKEEIEKFNKSDFLVDDLIGMVLYDFEGNLVGQIVDYEDYGSAPILSIEEGGHIYEVPYIKSVFVTQDGALKVNRKEYDGAKV